MASYTNHNDTWLCTHISMIAGDDIYWSHCMYLVHYFYWCFIKWHSSSIFCINIFVVVIELELEEKHWKYCDAMHHIVMLNGNPFDCMSGADTAKLG